MTLASLVSRSAAHTPAALAVSGPDQTLSYGELDRLANQLARALAQMGVARGDRVGIWVDKSAKAVVAMQAILRLGAAYVPLDPLSPLVRVSQVIQDCDLRVLVTQQQRAEQIAQTELAGLPCFTVDAPWQSLSWQDLPCFSAQPLALTEPDNHELAYILYTSGSTGRPKGVCISHGNALAFIEWAVQTLDIQPSDRFSNHAPFHFDLSVLDLYVAFWSGACVYLIPQGSAYLPHQLVNFLVDHQITVWYSVPSALIMMMQQSNLLTARGLALRAVIFAGEPFPVKYLRSLVQWRGVRFLNFYGPTETNVCTYFEVEGLSPDRKEPIPIGKACSGNQVWAMKVDGTVAQAGEEGELMVSGPTVMLGYWGRPPQGKQAYATGDLVRLQPDGNYVYIGRRDHLVKVRGHRVEPGDIEAVLLLHPAIAAAAAIAIGEGIHARLVAFLVTQPHQVKLNVLQVKQHCAKHLPRYMIVDAVHHLPALPRTGNGKVDRSQLATLATVPRRRAVESRSP